MAMTVIQKLTKTRKSIEAHTARGQGLGENGSINHRGCELVDRYNSLREQAIEVGGYSNPEWRAYCDSFGACYSHNGHDLFA